MIDRAPHSAPLESGSQRYECFRSAWSALSRKRPTLEETRHQRKLHHNFKNISGRSLLGVAPPPDLPAILMFLASGSVYGSFAKFSVPAGFRVLAS